MTRQVINVGSTPNDKKGDSLRAAFQKVNSNFEELYSFTGESINELKEISQDLVAEILVNGDHQGAVVEYNDQDNKLNIIVNNIIDGGNANSNYNNE
jgi:hypothetical protein